MKKILILILLSITICSCDIGKKKKIEHYINGKIVETYYTNEPVFEHANYVSFYKANERIIIYGNVKVTRILK